MERLIIIFSLFFIITTNSYAASLSCAQTLQNTITDLKDYFPLKDRTHIYNEGDLGGYVESGNGELQSQLKVIQFHFLRDNNIYDLLESKIKSSSNEFKIDHKDFSIASKPSNEDEKVVIEWTQKNNPESKGKITLSKSTKMDFMLDYLTDLEGGIEPNHKRHIIESISREMIASYDDDWPLIFHIVMSEITSGIGEIKVANASFSSYRELKKARRKYVTDSTLGLLPKNLSELLSVFADLMKENQKPINKDMDRSLEWNDSDNSVLLKGNKQTLIFESQALVIEAKFDANGDNVFFKIQSKYTEHTKAELSFSSKGYKLVNTSEGPIEVLLGRFVFDLYGGMTRGTYKKVW